MRKICILLLLCSASVTTSHAAAMVACHAHETYEDVRLSAQDLEFQKARRRAIEHAAVIEHARKNVGILNYKAYWSLAGELITSRLIGSPANSNPNSGNDHKSNS